VKVREEFVVAEPPTVLWEFFERVDRVAYCVPGVEEVRVIDADNSRVRVTQTVGPMTATFDVKMRITARSVGRSMEFTAIGRSVSGAAGNLRSTNTILLEDADGGSTRVVLESEVALGGMLGSVGQKVVAKQATKVTRSFAEALQRELSGGAGDTSEGTTAQPPEAGARAVGVEPAELQQLPGRRGPGSAAVGAAVGAVLLALLLLIRRRRGR
jgi:uncharacterized protein